jgi:hypothetical protein
MSEFPYGDYANFFARWFGNGAFITFAFLLWLAITVHTVFTFRRRKWWFRAPLVSAVSVVHYLIFGLLVAGGRFGGEAEFMYDPTLFKDNMFIHGGFQRILLWPLSLLPTGGFLVVFPVVAIGVVYLFKRRQKKESGIEQGGQA